MNPKTTQESELLDRIRALQAVQKTARPDSARHTTASKELAPLFAEMARRYPSGRVGPAV